MVLNFLIIFIVVVVVYLNIVSPPKYSDSETKIAEQNLSLALENAGDFRPQVEQVLNYLKDYPEYYQKVVNNISGLEVIDGGCSCSSGLTSAPACVISSGTIQVNGFTDLATQIILPEANVGDKQLVIDPQGGKGFKTDSEFASMLIHETDHIEYLESGRLRRAALKIKCSAFLNPHISINSRLGDVSHRLKTIEICAEKEEIRFHKMSDTKSGYEVENGIYYSFPSYMLGPMKNALAIILGIFRTVLNIF